MPQTRIRRNLALLLLSQVATFLLSVVTVAFVPKLLGPQAYGDLAVAWAYMGFFALASALGTGTFLVKTVARDPSTLGSYLFNALVLKLLLALPITGLAIGSARFLGYRPETTKLIEVVSLGILLGAATDVLGAGLQATGRMGRLALWPTAQRFVSTAAALVVLLRHYGVAYYALVVTCSGLIPAAAFMSELWTEIRTHLQLRLRLWKTLLTGGLPYFLWSAILLVYGSIDILMLGRMTTAETVGWYSLAYTWVGIPVFFPSILATAIFPSLSSSAPSRSPEFVSTANKALQLVVAAGTPMAVGIALTASNIIGLFHYPAQFYHSILLIQILALHVPVVGMDMILGLTLIAMDRQRAWVIVGCIAAVFNPAANLVAIPLTSHAFGDGAIGAAVVTVATELVMMIGAIVLRAPGILDRHTLTVLVRSVVASATMIPTVLIVDRTPFAVKVAVGIATFAASCYALRLMSVRTARDGLISVLDSLHQRERQPRLNAPVEPL